MMDHKDGARGAIFPGTFDPVTNGHLDLIQRGLTLFDCVVIGVAQREEKGPLFTHDERMEMMRRVASRFAPRVEVRDFRGLLVHFAEEIGVSIVIRGIRVVSDFEFEYQMALMNRRLSGVETVFLMPSEQYTYLNSTVVKEIARNGGSVTGLVPREVEEELVRRYPPIRRPTAGAGRKG